MSAKPSETYDTGGSEWRASGGRVATPTQGSSSSHSVASVRGETPVWGCVREGAKHVCPRCQKVSDPVSHSRTHARPPHKQVLR
eukprot:1669165-Prymnesium_polylepis.1